MRKHGLTKLGVSLAGLTSLLLFSTALAEPASPATNGERLQPTQHTTEDDRVAADGMVMQGADIIDAQGGNQMLLTQLLGMPVMAADGESIGKVGDVLLTHDGQAAGIIITMGGILGVGGRDVAIPWSKLVAYADDGELEVLAMDVRSEMLEAAPAFQTRDMQIATQIRQRTIIEPAAGPPWPLER
jgi:sporulation protein YlmC with PRC-barrel domain